MQLLTLSLVSLYLIATVSAFVPQQSVRKALTAKPTFLDKKTELFGFLNDEDPKQLTRDNEPDDYFQT